MKNKFLGFVVLFVSYLIIYRAMRNKDSMIYKSVCSCAESIRLMIDKFLENKIALNDKNEKSKSHSNANKSSD